MFQVYVPGKMFFRKGGEIPGLTATLFAGLEISGITTKPISEEVHFRIAYYGSRIHPCLLCAERQEVREVKDCIYFTERSPFYYRLSTQPILDL